MSQPEQEHADRLAADLIARCTSLGLTVGAAESLTGGLLIEPLAPACAGGTAS